MLSFEQYMTWLLNRSRNPFRMVNTGTGFEKKFSELFLPEDGFITERPRDKNKRPDFLVLDINRKTACYVELKNYLTVGSGTNVVHLWKKKQEEQNKALEELGSSFPVYLFCNTRDGQHLLKYDPNHRLWLEVLCRSQKTS